MAVYVKDKIRNIAIIGHSGEGKTSLLEAILFKTKMTGRWARWTKTTPSDFDQEKSTQDEHIRGVAYALYKAINSIYRRARLFDFEGEMVAALTAADCAMMASASGQVTVGAEKDRILRKQGIYVYFHKQRKQRKQRLL